MTLGPAAPNKWQTPHLVSCIVAPVMFKFENGGLPFIRRGRPEGHKILSLAVENGDGGRIAGQSSPGSQPYFFELRCVPQKLFFIFKSVRRKNPVRLQMTRPLMIQFFQRSVARRSLFLCLLARWSSAHNCRQKHASRHSDVCRRSFHFQARESLAWK